MARKRLYSNSALNSCANNLERRPRKLFACWVQRHYQDDLKLCSYSIRASCRLSDLVDARRCTIEVVLPKYRLHSRDIHIERSIKINVFIKRLWTWIFSLYFNTEIVGLPMSECHGWKQDAQRQGNSSDTSIRIQLFTAW